MVTVWFRALRAAAGEVQWDAARFTVALLACRLASRVRWSRLLVPSRLLNLTFIQPGPIHAAARCVRGTGVNLE